MTEPYTPTEDQVREWCAEGLGEYRDVMDAWVDRFLARVKRDAAREALYGYADALNENPHAAVWGWHDFVRDARDWADTIYPIPEETP